MYKFSVVLPVYNSQNTINESLGSVLTQLSSDDEVIIVDDGSSDSTISIIESISDKRIRLLRHTYNQGISESRNSALSIATGDYIAFIDGDDVWPELRQKQIKEIILKRPVDMIFGLIEHFYCPTLTHDEREKFHLPRPQIGCIPGSTVLSRNCIEKVGKFNTNLSSGEFIDYIARLKPYSPVQLKLDIPVLRRRIHRNNHTTKNKEGQFDYLKVIRKHLQRNKAL